MSLTKEGTLPFHVRCGGRVAKLFYIIALIGVMLGAAAPFSSTRAEVPRQAIASRTAAPPAPWFSSSGLSQRLKRFSQYVLRPAYVVKAWSDSYQYVPGEVAKRVPQELHEVLGGLVKGLLLAAGVIGLITAVGAALGAVAGAPAGGIGAVPGAVAGATAGFKISMAVMNYLGLGFLAAYVGNRLGNIGRQLYQGVKAAWNSRGNLTRINAASRRMAVGYGILASVLITGLILYVAARGIQGVASRALPAAKKTLFARSLPKFDKAGKLSRYTREHAAVRVIKSECFAAGTPVHAQRDGQPILIPIQDIQVGDLVKSRNPATGEEGYKPVVQTFTGATTTLLTLTFANSETLQTTPNHPFATSKRGDFVLAKHLRSDLSVITGSGFSHLAGEQAREGLFPVFNFKVADWHTYFVGKSGIWVHNANCNVSSPKIINNTRIHFPVMRHTNLTPGHWFAILRKVDSLAKSGRYKEIYINRDFTANTGIPLRRGTRPDITAIRRNANKTIDLFEVPSKTDRPGRNGDYPVLTERMKTALRQVPDLRRGKGRIILIR